jgi:hypothetical protein
MSTYCYVVRGTLDDQAVVRHIVAPNPTQAYWTCKELWPTVRISAVVLEEQWSLP